MKDYKTENIRNICLGAHSGAGKTSLAEALLFNLGVASRIGTIENGNTISDYNDDEIERQISISSALLHGEWDNNKINFIDTPGYSDFFGEVVGALNATDAVMVVISAAGGVEVGTEMVWNKAKNLNLPRMIVINKLDRENLNFDNVINSLQEAFGRKVVLTQFPVNAGPGFNSIVDLIRKKLHCVCDYSVVFSSPSVIGRRFISGFILGLWCVLFPWFGIYNKFNSCARIIACARLLTSSLR